MLMGLEPTTFCMTNRYSNQLSYTIKNRALRMVLDTYKYDSSTCLLYQCVNFVYSLKLEVGLEPTTHHFADGHSTTELLQPNLIF